MGSLELTLKTDQRGSLLTVQDGCVFRKVPTEGPKEIPSRIIMFCISGIHVAYSSSQTISVGYKQHITVYALFVIWIC